MYSWYFNNILNHQPVRDVQLVIQQYTELTAGYSQLAVWSALYLITSQVQMYSWLFNSTMYIELPVSTQCTFSNSAIY